MCPAPQGTGGGRMGLCCPRKDHRAWTTAEVGAGNGDCSEGPPKGAKRKSRGEISFQGASGVGKRRPQGLHSCVLLETGAMPSGSAVFSACF